MWDINMVYIYIYYKWCVYIFIIIVIIMRDHPIICIYIYPGYIQKMCKYPLISYKLIWLVVYLQ